MTCALVWLGAFAVFLHSLTPGLGGEDAGEFIPAFATLGATHPPGYPLLILLGRLSLTLPVGSPAFRANLLSAACAAGALTLLFALIRRAAGTAAGLAAAVLLGASPAFRYQAVIADKYPLHLLLFTGTLTAAFTGGRPGTLLLLAGLGAAHHPQVIYLLPALLWWAWRTRPDPTGSLRAGVFAVAAACSLKVLEPPLRGPGPWPLVFDPPLNAHSLWSTLTLRPYAHRIVGLADGRLWHETLSVIADQLTPAGAVAGVAGLLWWARRDRTRGTAALLTAATGLLLVSMLDIFGREYHALPVTLLLCAGFGMLIGAGIAGHPVRRILLGLLLIPGWQVYHALPMAGHGQAYLEFDYGRRLLGGLPPRAVLFVSNDDHFFSTMFQQTMEGFRTDVLIIPRGYLTIPFLKSRTLRSAPELAPILQAPFRPSEEDRAARVAVDLFMQDGRACYTTSEARKDLYAGLTLESRDAVFEIVGKTPHHPATSLWYPVRKPGLDPRAMTWKHRLMETTQAAHQSAYGTVLDRLGRHRDAGLRFLNAR